MVWFDVCHAEELRFRGGVDAVESVVFCSDEWRVFRHRPLPVVIGGLRISQSLQVLLDGSDGVVLYESSVFQLFADGGEDSTLLRRSEGVPEALCAFFLPLASAMVV